MKILMWDEDVQTRLHKTSPDWRFRQGANMVDESSGKMRGRITTCSKDWKVSQSYREKEDEKEVLIAHGLYNIH